MNELLESGLYSNKKFGLVNMFTSAALWSSVDASPGAHCALDGRWPGRTDDARVSKRGNNHVARAKLPIGLVKLLRRLICSESFVL
jgi:hypothetical protein